MIHCASLVYIEQDRILLVRVRDNISWYLPGGKISPGEHPTEALSRELAEELHLSICPSEFEFLTEVVTDNHDGSDQVQLFAYTLSSLPVASPGAEISELAWFDLSDTERMAPAVIEVLEVINNGI